jgi:hypothetical protein
MTTIDATENQQYTSSVSNWIQCTFPFIFRSDVSFLCFIFASFKNEIKLNYYGSRESSIQSKRHVIGRMGP